MIGIWLALYLFILYRRPIQSHIRKILEANKEFQIETLIKNNIDIVTNCKYLFVIILFSTVTTQLLSYYIEDMNLQNPEDLKEMTGFVENIINNCLHNAINFNPPDVSGFEKDT